MEQDQELVREIQKGLLNWYNFKQDGAVLYIGEEGDALAEMLKEHPHSLRLTYVSADQVKNITWQQEHPSSFDYIIAIEKLEQEQEPISMLRRWTGLMRPDGKLLLGMNNRLGARYFCGDRDPYTERNFDGIENYRRFYAKKADAFRGRCYSDMELQRMLKEAGWRSFCFLSVLPDLKNPSLLYREDYLPNEDLANRLIPTYNYPATVFLEEESLYGGLAENGLFHKMANAWLVECSLNSEPVDRGFGDVLHVTSSMDRGRDCASLTVIRSTGIVEKRAVYPEGLERLERMLDHGKCLAARGVPVVEARIENGICVMPYLEYEVGQIYLKRLIKTDREKFLGEMDHFRELILRSSRHVKEDSGDGRGVILEKGYPDMVPLNSFHIDDEFVFYDQEFCQENYPANVIIARMVDTFYSGNMELQKIVSMEELYERYGLTQYLPLWRKMAGDFLSKLLKRKELRLYHEGCRRDGEALNTNRQRINYREDKYNRLFLNIFEDADKKELILFGSGVFARKFLALYSKNYPVYGIVDNNKDKWGKELEGIPIQAPDILLHLKPEEYKVIICMKDYLSVMKQLDDMGIKRYCIFDSNRDYPDRKNKEMEYVRRIQEEKNPSLPQKKFHTGYIAGVFDLFHIGHLNMFKRAKEQCDYLIVGVVTDEAAGNIKKKGPFVPFEERIEMVRSCRYVDEAVEIPMNYGGTRDAYRMYHFDCQFSGSDYMDNPDWLADKKFLERHGAEMVFFPYTQSTSSTKLKELIEKRLV